MKNVVNNNCSLAVGFKTGILCLLKMVHLCRNMSFMLKEVFPYVLRPKQSRNSNEHSPAVSSDLKRSVFRFRPQAPRFCLRQAFFIPQVLSEILDEKLLSRVLQIIKLDTFKQQVTSSLRCWELVKGIQILS